MGWLENAQSGLSILCSDAAADEALFPIELQRSLAKIHRHLNPKRTELLNDRKIRQKLYDNGDVPHYIESHPSHDSDWTVAPIPNDLLDRRVEITGPVNNTKMVINMLSANSNGEIPNTAMLDFEDSMCPTWENVIDGIKNVVGVARGSLTHLQEAEGSTPQKLYALDTARMAHPMIRVRGLHLQEANVLIDGEAIAAGLFDLVVCAFHSANLFLTKKITPKYYIPKVESYHEARWWNLLFRIVESELGLPEGSIRCTLLIETLPAAFQMEEILFEVRERACGLNGGRWDKIFSDIKVLKNHSNRILADRSTIDMTKPWMENYAKRLVKICHKHGAFAMGGMSAFTPGKDAVTRNLQTEKVKMDKVREAGIGHDGCWISHPYFTDIARAQFPAPNQLSKQLNDFPLYPDLLPQATGPKTLAGLRTNIRVAIAYTHGWNQGLGCISFENLMEDLATLEISRAQVWQWLHHKSQLEDGTVVNSELVSELFEEECARFLSEESENIDDLDAFKTVCQEYLAATRFAKNLFLEHELPDFFSTYQPTPSGGRNGTQREGTRITLEYR